MQSSSSSSSSSNASKASKAHRAKSNAAPAIAEITDSTAKIVTAERRMEEDGQGSDRRLTVVDRRAGIERRQKAREEAGYDGPDRRADEDRRNGTGLERRRGPGRRRSDDRKAAEEGEMTAEQFEFCMAIEMYKKVNKRLYPTWTEVLEVVRQLGYRKVEHRNINLPNVPEPELNKTQAAWREANHKTEE